jgi:outer membrane murein-binding lipoprotein Lpp
MNNELLLIISNILTGIASFFVGKRRSDVETDNMVLRNLELSIGVYQKIIEDLKTEIRELNNKVDHLEKKVEELMSENRSLKKNSNL